MLPLIFIIVHHIVFKKKSPADIFQNLAEENQNFPLAALLREQSEEEEEERKMRLFLVEVLIHY